MASKRNTKKAKTPKNKKQGLFPSLRPWVTSDGWVNYSLLRQKTGYQMLQELHANITKQDTSTMNHDELKSFYMNYYNYLVLKSVVDKLIKSQSFAGNTSFVQRTMFFYLTKHAFADGTKINLYDLENKLIRPLGDPRIHFCINCCAYSCPRLPREPFVATDLDAQMDDLTARFINEHEGVLMKNGKLEVSAIFKWYKSDFKGSGGVASFIKDYWTGEDFDPNTVKITYQSYNWILNNTILDPIEDCTEEPIPEEVESARSQARERRLNSARSSSGVDSASSVKKSSKTRNRSKSTSPRSSKSTKSGKKSSRSVGKRDKRKASKDNPRKPTK